MADQQIGRVEFGPAVTGKRPPVEVMERVWREKYDRLLHLARRVVDAEIIVYGEDPDARVALDALRDWVYPPNPGEASK